jgi:thiamine-phosphate pyrophosphorylase
VSLPAKFPRTPILCYVTDRANLAASDAGDARPLLERIAAATVAGVDWIQIREKDLSGKDLSVLVRDSLSRSKQSHQDSTARILVNDRIDVALAEHAGGVHLREHSLPVHDISRWLGSLPNQSELSDFLVGASCHSLDSAMKADRDGVSYILFGPVFSTPSKAVFGEPQGLSLLKEVCNSVSVPVLAIGGITLENGPACLHSGAAGIAAIRLFQDATDLPALVEQLRAARS